MFKAYTLKFSKLKNEVDWKLLLFLLLFLNVKLAVKIPAIIIMYLAQTNFRFGLSFKNSRLPLFYLLIAIIGTLQMLLIKSYQAAHYPVVFITGICFWILCLLAVHQVKLSVEKNDAETLHRTILIFFAINALFSFLNLTAIICEIGTLNPYRYQGQFQKYFIGTGDYIKGITFDASTTNAVLNAFGVVYFLVRKNALMVCICMIILLLTGSNFINIMLFCILTGLFIFKSVNDQKSLIVVCLGLLIIFMVKVSPQNTHYVAETFNNLQHKITPSLTPPNVAVIPITQIPDSLLSPDEKRQKFARLYLDSLQAANLKTKPVAASIAVSAKVAPATSVPDIKPDIPKPSIHSKPFQSATDTTPDEKKLLTFIDTHESTLHIPHKIAPLKTLPGKVLAMQQTLLLFKFSPKKIWLGDGMGNFSSKLAFRVSNLGFAGGFPAKYAYISPDFLTNHLKVYLNYFSKRSGFHSLTNSPNSVYDQLISEYGLPGILIFLVFYIGYFLRHYKRLTYGIPLLLLLSGVFFIEYWFEQLSVVVFFELLMLVNIKETAPQTNLPYENK